MDLSFLPYTGVEAPRMSRIVGRAAAGLWALVTAMRILTLSQNTRWIAVAMTPRLVIPGFALHTSKLKPR